MKIYHLNQLWLNCSDNLCLKFGKHYVWPSMKNTIWNECGILVAKIGLTSTNIAEAVKHFAAYTLRAIALDS